MSKLTNYIYTGEHVNGADAAVGNGIVMLMGTSTNAGKMVLPSSADTTSKFLCVEVGTIYDGVTAYRFVVNKLNDAYYFIENEFEYFNDSEAYDNRNHTVPVGELLRAHPLQVGDEFWTTAVTGTIAAGTAYGVKTDGTIG